MHALGYDIILVKDASLEAPPLEAYIRKPEEAFAEINSYGKILTTEEVLKLIP
jgi:nicotinamidase-related amidase